MKIILKVKLEGMTEAGYLVMLFTWWLYLLGDGACCENVIGYALPIWVAGHSNLDGKNFRFQWQQKAVSCGQPTEAAEHGRKWRLCICLSRCSLGSEIETWGQSGDLLGQAEFFQD